MICRNSGTRTRVHAQEPRTGNHLKHNVYYYPCHGSVTATQELEQKFKPETKNNSKHNVYHHDESTQVTNRTPVHQPPVEH